MAECLFESGIHEHIGIAKITRGTAIRNAFVDFIHLFHYFGAQVIKAFGIEMVAEFRCQAVVEIPLQVSRYFKCFPVRVPIGERRDHRPIVIGWRGWDKNDIKRQRVAVIHEQVLGDRFRYAVRKPFAGAHWAGAFFKIFRDELINF